MKSNFDFLTEKWNELSKGSKVMNKIHRSSCRFLFRKQDEGKRTTTLEKICSSNLSDLEKYVIRLRGKYWVYCKSCNYANIAVSE